MDGVTVDIYENLQKAMEVTGIEGNYGITCERVMNLMRENKDSMLAVLEAFVYDPLFNFRMNDNRVFTSRLVRAYCVMQRIDASPTRTRAARRRPW